MSRSSAGSNEVDSVGGDSFLSDTESLDIGVMDIEVLCSKGNASKSVFPSMKPWPDFFYGSAANLDLRPMSERYCPYCDTQMEKTNVTAEGIGDLYVETERDGGVLDRLGVGYQTPLHAFLCPECGMTQLYADLSE